jgi:AraC-like DNA-binding protein
MVSTLLARRYPSIQLVSGALGMSARTLQRRLAAAGLTYVSLVAQARGDMARRMLGDPAPKIGDIARAVGYSDAGHFTRAFLRWTGLTPREFRRLQRRTAGDIPGPPAASSRTAR